MWPKQASLLGTGGGGRTQRFIQTHIRDFAVEGYAASNRVIPQQDLFSSVICVMFFSDDKP